MSWPEIPRDSRLAIRVPPSDTELLELALHAALANVAIIPDTVPESVVEQLRELLLAQGHED
jgi:hypothetical protein